VILLSLLQAGCLPEPPLTITLGGDVIPGRDGQAIFTENPWGNIAPADSTSEAGQNWFLVNLESPLASQLEAKSVSAEGYNLCAPSETAEILKMGGVDLVSTANNHQGDCSQSLDPSRAIEGLSVVSEAQPFFLEGPDGTIAVIAVDAVSKPLDITSLLDRVADLEAKSDLVIVSLHWGMEYAGEPTTLQREQAKQLANAGVDVLWGHHPHVLQPAEGIVSENGEHRMLALFSLGNLLTDQTMTYETRHSALVQIRFQAGEIRQLSFQPLVLLQKEGELSLAYPHEEAVKHISERLGWTELSQSLP